MNSLEYELADLQCLEACIQQGWTIEDWLEYKQSLIEYLQEREG